MSVATMMPRLLATSVAILVCSVGIGSRAAAQGTPPSGPRLTAPWASVTVDRGLPVGRRLGADLMQRASRPRAPGTVLMIVGGAVAGAGILADESLLIVGGVAVAGYGLYLYLR